MASLKKYKQSGAVLLVSLIMLLLLTILGITSLKTTTIEEKMSGNLRDKDLAFQAAESAVRDAERAIRSLINTSDFYGGAKKNGYYSSSVFNDTTDLLEPDMPAIIASTANWSDDDASIAAATAIPGVKTAPRYMIQHSQHVVPEDDISFGGYGTNKAGSEIDYFKIFARGTGGTDNAQVILETVYGMRF